jgi:hypothetical protein
VLGAGPVLERAAAGVAWLAARGVLYTDLRGPNVLIAPRASYGAGGAADEAAANGEAGAGDGILLIDYDDCYALEAPVRSVAGFREALVATGAVAACPEGFAGLYACGELPDVEEALERAFAAAARE